MFQLKSPTVNATQSGIQSRLRASLPPEASPKSRPAGMTRGIHQGIPGLVLTPAAISNQVLRGEVQQDASLYKLKTHAAHP